MRQHPACVREYFTRVGAEVLNFRRAMVKSYREHYYLERALIKINSDGTVTCSDKELAPTPVELAAMKAALADFEFPRTITARDASGLKGKTKGECYEFIDRQSGEILMVQERRISKAGVKSYIPWVFTSEGEWVAMEPDGDLPFWKPQHQRPGSGGKIMIHEGAKAADAVERLLSNGVDHHPWGEKLLQYEHWGMIGGALAPHRTDYAELKREAPTEVIYICDNDRPGTAALQKVSRHWGKALKGVGFGEKFPRSWDMADSIPSTLFSRGRYQGPKLEALFEPATWATELVPPAGGGKGRPAAVIKSEFVEEWQHCIRPEVFVHKEWPHRVFNAEEFNSKIAPFSHVAETAGLLKKEFSSKASVLKYVPGEVAGMHAGSPEGNYINTFAPTDIVAEKGDAGPWLEFMTHLIPDDGDRKELLRWCATLIARPDVRMLYGVLLISETQGIGKGTLGEKVLAPLVGRQNVSYPSEQEIVDSNFNYWLAHKRLAVVHEIYAGHSSKAYNKLKSALTDRFITAQKKYQANYEIENWIHLFACSNSMRAMKLSMDDRRWFVPRVTEEKRPKAYWTQFNDWLSDEGGLSIIFGWAQEWLKKEEPVSIGAAAPWSSLKGQIVEEGYSPGQAIVARELERIKEKVAAGELGGDVFVLDCDLVAVIRNELYEGRHNDKLERPSTVRSVAKALGWSVGETRAQIKGWGPATAGARVLALDPAVAALAPSALGGEKLEEAARRRPLSLVGMAGL